MVGARCVAADAQSSHDLAVAVKRETAAEEDQAARYLRVSGIATTTAAGRNQKLSVKQVRLAQAPQRMTRLGKCVEPRSRQRQRVKAERVGGIGVRFGDRLAARPNLRGVVGRRDRRA